MNQKLIYILFISLFTGLLKSQDSPKTHHFFIGVDVANPVFGLFSDKKNYSGYLSYQIKNRWSIATEIGYEKNIYKKNNWDTNAEGFFGTLGFNYILTNFYEKSGEGFYTGLRFGFSPFTQQIKAFPERNINTTEGGNNTIIHEGLPKANVSSGWLEAVLGAKVQIAESPIFLDLMVKPKFLIYSKKQNNIDNLVIPGYGKDKGNANISFIWGISYKLF